LAQAFYVGVARRYESGRERRVILKWWLLINVALMSVLSTFPSLPGFASPVDFDRGVHASTVDTHAAHHIGHSGDSSEPNEDGTLGGATSCGGHGGCRTECCNTCVYCCALALVMFSPYVETLKIPAPPPFAASHLGDYIPPLLERPPI